MCEQNIDSNKAAQCWFAMRVTFKRELQVKQMLDTEGIENFVPMRRETRTIRGRRTQVMVPVIHNLIFIKTDKQTLQKVKSKAPHLQYMMMRKGTDSKPIIVPNRQMEEFITVTSSDDAKLLYCDTNDVNLATGTVVRIHGGPFDGLIGTFVKVKGKRSKKVVVAIQNVLAVALDTYKYDYMEIIK